MSQAKKLCETRQMDLIRIETPAEQDLLSNFLSSQCIVQTDSLYFGSISD